jgi:hypothetical protein
MADEAERAANAIASRVAVEATNELRVSGLAGLRLGAVVIKPGGVRTWLSSAEGRLSATKSGGQWKKDPLVLTGVAAEIAAAASLAGGLEVVATIATTLMAELGDGRMTWEAFREQLCAVDSPSAGAVGGARAEMKRLAAMQQGEMTAVHFVELFKVTARAVLGEARLKDEYWLAAVEDMLIRGLRSERARRELQCAVYTDFGALMAKAREVAVQSEAAEKARTAGAASASDKGGEATGSRKGKGKGKGPAGQARPSQRGQISSAEQERRRDRGLCFNCTSADHKARDCTAPFVPEA